jgi:hypothetical protein
MLSVFLDVYMAVHPQAADGEHGFPIWREVANVLKRTVTDNRKGTQLK